ncbi:MAG: hypothetical protein CME62_05955 [Halobacteriovoraceae bacterium]|nr:hypothetical protein [Halobacteriovoraceae bacterium]
MKTLLIVLLTFTATTHGAEWYEQIVSEDQDHFYYVGVSSKKKSRKEAMEDAYADALKEAVRHNFGVIHNYMGQYDQSETDVQVHQSTLLYRSGVKVKGTIPLKLKIIEEDDRYIAYRKISYPKREIAAEKDRLNNINEKKYQLKPVQMTKLEAKREQKKEQKQKSKPAPSLELPRFSWVYNPVMGDEEKTEFINLPLKIEFYMWKHLSLGFAYFQDSDEYKEDYDANKDDSLSSYYDHNAQETYTEDTTDFVVDLKLYPIRTKWFAIGIGGEYISHNEVVYRGDTNSEANIQKETSFETTGTNLTLKVTLREYIPHQQNGISLYTDMREYEDRKMYSMGLTMDF